ncbi:hypothetical protein D3C80_1358130 [compost metagenome]
MVWRGAVARRDPNRTHYKNKIGGFDVHDPRVASPYAAAPQRHCRPLPGLQPDLCTARRSRRSAGGRAAKPGCGQWRTGGNAVAQLVALYRVLPGGALGRCRAQSGQYPLERGGNHLFAGRLGNRGTDRRRCLSSAGCPGRQRGEKYPPGDLCRRRRNARRHAELRSADCRPSAGRGRPSPW